MLIAALVAYGHYLSIMTVFAALVVEWVTIQKSLSWREVRLLIWADSFYGLAAIVVVGTGLLRAFYYGKGPDYYWNHPLFITKVAIFTLVGLLSIVPTVSILKMRKAVHQRQNQIEWRNARSMKILVSLELILLLTLPFWASLLASNIHF